MRETAQRGDRWSLVFASMLLLSSLVACAPQPSKRTQPASLPVASLSPPAAVGDLALDRTHRYEDPAYGVQYSYGVARGAPHDVYVYPIGGDAPLDTSEGLRRALDALVHEFATGLDQAVAQGIYASATSDEDARVQSRLQDRCLPGHYRRVILVKDGESYASEMYGFALYGHYVKFRISQPIGGYSAARSRAFVDGFMAKLEVQINVYVDDTPDPDELIVSAMRAARQRPATCEAASARP
jgi:hypothetical protein